MPPAEPAEWAHAIFSTVDTPQGYFLGAVDPETGTHRRGQLAYRLYLDTDRQAIPVPPSGAHLPALSALCHRRQRADHHSHDGLTITDAASQPNLILTCNDDMSPSNQYTRPQPGRLVRRDDGAPRGHNILDVVVTASGDRDPVSAGTDCFGEVGDRGRDGRRDDVGVGQTIDAS